MNELFDAAARGDLDEVKRLVAQGADVNTVNLFGDTPLHWAAVNGHATILNHYQLKLVGLCLGWKPGSYSKEQ